MLTKDAERVFEAGVIRLINKAVFLIPHLRPLPRYAVLHPIYCRSNFKPAIYTAIEP